MKPLFKKIIIIFCLTCLPLVIIFYRNFIFFRRGWNVPEIQYHTIYWMVRVLLCPLVIFFTIKCWRELNKLFFLLFMQLSGFIIYTLTFWCTSFFFARLLPGFDGRNLNLFNTIKDDSLVLNVLIYTITVFIVYLWVYFENNKETEKKISILKKSLTELKHATFKEKRDPKSLSGNEKINKLTIKSGYKTTILSVQEIICFLSDGPYVRAITATGVHLISKPLYELQLVLPHFFLRVHRSHIVNTDCIKEVRSLLNGDYTLVLKNGDKIRASRTYRENLKSILNKI